MSDLSDGIERSAEISECGQYRWWLKRRWGEGQEVCFVMLNPSDADAFQDDPTIRRCIDFAKAWGYGSLVVRNLYAFRTPHPAVLKEQGYPTGGERGDSELELAHESDLVVCAWGGDAPEDRVSVACRLLSDIALCCLGITKSGQPRHPLYVAADQELLLWT